MAVRTASGTEFYIATASTANSLVDFQAITEGDWVQVGEVETYGEVGDEAPLVPFASVGDGRVRKSKGARDAGTMAVTVGRDPFDAGQIALIAAEKTSFEYAFRIVFNDAPTAAYSDTVKYFRGPVASVRDNIGGNDNIVRMTCNIAVNTELFEEPSALLSP